MRKFQLEEEYHDIVIVGGGICGIATALALHRKGINSLILERSETLRATGASISIYLNGWHALDQLGVGEELRTKCIPITEIQHKSMLKEGKEVISIREEGLRIVKRSELVETMAAKLPSHSIRFGCQIVAVETDFITSFPVISLGDGSRINTKVLIGCDGSNSVVAKALGLKEPKKFQTCVVQGFTNYPNGHNYNHLLLLQGDNFLLGRVPVDGKLIFWFINKEFHPKDLETKQSPIMMRDQTLGIVKDCSVEITEMVQNCDLSSLSLVHIRYRAPWHIAFSALCKGTVTVAGDAMHQMHPSIGQGGCAALEDAVVLARCLSEEMQVCHKKIEVSDCEVRRKAGDALRRYTKERRWRILILSTKAYLIGSLFGASWVKRLIFLSVFTKLFGGRFKHTQYNCGHL